MPTPQPAPADTGTPRQAPLPPPSVRRPLPANVPRTPRPINGRRLSCLVRKLHGWELDHLRAHCAELQAENERLQREAHYADDCAEMWRRDVERMQEDGATIGMTPDGQLHRIDAGEVLLPALQVGSQPVHFSDRYGSIQIGNTLQASAWTSCGSRHSNTWVPNTWFVQEHRADQAGRMWLRTYAAITDDFGDLVEVAE